MEEKTQKEIDELKERISALEKWKSEFEKTPRDTKIPHDTFKGLKGGIRFLIKNGFLNSPKPVTEIKKELVREGYHQSIQSVDSAIRYFHKKRILTRDKKSGVWKYAVKK